MILTTEQSMMLDNLRDTHAELAMKRSTLRAQVEKELESRLNAILRRRSRLANECVAAGISKTKVGRAMGTSDWKTISSILAITRDEFETDQNAGKAYRVENLDEQGSPTAVTLEVYKDRATGEVVRGPITIPLVRLPFSRKISWIPDDPATSKVLIGYLYDVTLEINEGLIDPDDEPVAPAAKAPDDYRARFFVPDDDGEDED